LVRVCPESIFFFLNGQPTEEAASLLAAMIKPTAFNQANAGEIRAWCISCLEFFRSPIEISTFMYLMAKGISFFEDGDLGTIAEIVIQALGSDNEMCVLICMALKVFRKLTVRRVEFSPEVRARIVGFAHVCPTSDASKALSALFRFQREQTLQFASEVFESLLEAVMAHLQSDEDMDSVQDLLVVLSQIIQASNGAVVQDNSLPVFAALLGRFDRYDSGEELGLCFAAMFSTDCAHSPSFLSLLLEAIQSNTALYYGMAHLAPAIQLLLTRITAPLEVLTTVVDICIAAVSMDVSYESKRAAADLLCSIVQMNPPIDLAGVIQICDDERFPGWNLLVSSLFLAGQIEVRDQDVPEIGLATARPCPYEKLMSALTFLHFAGRRPELAAEVVPTALDFLSERREQQRNLGNAEPAFTCSHYLPFPIESTDITGVLSSVIPHCPPEMQHEILAFCTGEDAP
jgi:hypothetical protein